MGALAAEPRWEEDESVSEADSAGRDDESKRLLVNASTLRKTETTSTTTEWIVGIALTNQSGRVAEGVTVGSAALGEAFEPRSFALSSEHEPRVVSDRSCESDTEYSTGPAEREVFAEKLPELDDMRDEGCRWPKRRRGRQRFSHSPAQNP